jgi:general secretion pathway protein K
MRNESDERGLVLIAVLWIVIILTVIITSVVRSSRLNVKVSLAAQDSVCRRWAGLGGIETAEAVLREDLTASDSLFDLWNDNERDFNNIQLGNYLFTVKVIDEAGKLNVNTATKEQLLVLPDMTEEIVSAIMDWRDSDEDQTTGGAERGYYQNLPFKYQIRNGPFRTIRELLLVRGVSERLLYGEDTNQNGQLDSNEKDGDRAPPADNEDNRLDKGWIEYLTCYSYDKNVDSDGNKKVNINQADANELKDSLGIKESHAKWIVENRGQRQYQSIADLINSSSPKESSTSSSGGDSQVQAEPLDLATFSNIADRITVDGAEQLPGRINVNTAPEIVLAALLGGDDKAYQLADNIVSHRENLSDGMKSIAEVLDVSAMDIDTFKKMANYITVRSNVFTIRSFASAESRIVSRGELQIEAVVDRGSSPSQVLYFYQGETN